MPFFNGMTTIDERNLNSQAIAVVKASRALTYSRAYV
jgi:hypothetical protein